MRWSGLPTGARLALASVALALFVPVYFLALPAIGPSAAGLVLVPVVLSGLLLGRSGGLAFGILAWSLNHVLMTISSGKPLTSFHPTEWVYLPILPAIAGTVGALVDLRARLHRSERELRAIIEHAPQTILITDRRGRVVFINRKDDISCRVGDRVFGTAPEPVQAKVEAALTGAIAEGETAQFEVDCHRDGAPLSLGFHVGPLREGGRTHGAIFLVSDVTERRAAEVALQHAERLSTLGTLVAGVAHEINNPLTYMRGNLELAQLDLEDALASDDPVRVREVASQTLANLPAITRGADRIAQITQSLRRIARPRQGTRAAEDVSRVAESVLTVAATKTPERATMTAKLEATKKIKADEAELAQLMLNLVLNAVQAVEGAPTPHVDVRTRDEEDSVVFEVHDNGPGITPDVRAQLFTPFFTTKADGTGLGLSICRRIADDHDGEITCDAPPGGGTTFRFRAPVAREEDTPSPPGAL